MGADSGCYLLPPNQCRVSGPSVLHEVQLVGLPYRLTSTDIYVCMLTRLEHTYDSHSYSGMLACLHGLSERQARELHMAIKKRGGKEKQQPMAQSQPATSRSIADPLAAEPWSPPASINPYTEHFH